MLMLERTFEGLGADVAAIALAPQADLLVASCVGKNTTVWDVATGAVIHRSYAGSDPVDGLAFAPDGRWLATAGNKRITRRDARGGWTSAGEARVDAFGLGRLAFASEAPLLAATVLGAVKVFETPSLRCVASLPAAGYLGRPSFSPDASLVASACKDVFVHRLSDGTVVRRFAHHERAMQVYEAAFSPDGRRLATCGMHPAVRLWDVGGGACVAEAKTRGPNVQAVAFTPNGRWLVTVSMARTGRRGTLEVFDASTMKRVAEDAIGWCPREALVVSADSSRIAVGAGNGVQLFVLGASTDTTASPKKATRRASKRR